MSKPKEISMSEGPVTFLVALFLGGLLGFWITAFVVLGGDPPPPPDPLVFYCQGVMDTIEAANLSAPAPCQELIDAGAIPGPVTE